MAVHRAQSDRDRCAELGSRLRAQHGRICERVRAHVCARVVDDWGEHGVEHEASHEAALAAAVDLAIALIEDGEHCREATPPAIVAQARSAARQGVPLDTLLRCYHAGQAKLADIIIEEVERLRSGGGGLALLRVILATQSARLDALIGEITVEHRGEHTRLARSSEQQRAEQVNRLLSDGTIDTSGLDYRFDGAWHLCAIALGPDAGATLGALAEAAGRELLLVRRDREVVWGWLGGLQPLSSADAASAPLPGAEAALVLGEPGRDLEGWRLTHRQAQMALRVALHAPQRTTRFADVGVIAPWLGDPVLARSFLDIYLSPIEDGRDGGATARETLREYYRAGHQVAAAAQALGVDRGTLRRRLDSIERRLGCSLTAHQAELQVALRLDGLFSSR